MNFGVFCVCFCFFVFFRFFEIGPCWMELPVLCRTRPGWPPEPWDQKCIPHPTFLVIFSCGMFTFSSKKHIQFLWLIFSSTSLCGWQIVELFGEHFSIRVLFNLTKIFQVLWLWVENCYLFFEGWLGRRRIWDRRWKTCFNST